MKSPKSHHRCAAAAFPRHPNTYNLLISTSVSSVLVCSPAAAARHPGRIRPIPSDPLLARPSPLAHGFVSCNNATPGPCTVQLVSVSHSREAISGRWCPRHERVLRCARRTASIFRIARGPEGQATSDYVVVMCFTNVRGNSRAMSKNSVSDSRPVKLSMR